MGTVREHCQRGHVRVQFESGRRRCRVCDAARAKARRDADADTRPPKPIKPPKPAKPTKLEAFMRGVQIDDASGCWEWTRWRSRGGYGQTTEDRRTVYAHRLSYEMHVGPISDGLQLDHLCRNRGCVNPSHLEPVTPRENLLRGVALPSANAKKTHCSRGHEFRAASVPGKRRNCRVCHNMTNVARRHHRQQVAS